jgi:hypothetical protein
MTAFPVGMHMLSTGFSNYKCRCVINLAFFHRSLSDFETDFRWVFPTLHRNPFLVRLAFIAGF